MIAKRVKEDSKCSSVESWKPSQKARTAGVSSWGHEEIPGFGLGSRDRAVVVLLGKPHTRDLTGLSLEPVKI